MKAPTLSWENGNNIKISDIIINGLSEIKDKFILQNFTSLSLLEQNILNLSEGDSIKFKTETAGKTVQITPNNFTDLQDNIKEISYRFSDSDTTSFTPLSILNLGDDSNTYKHQMRSLLCLNSSPEYVQTLDDNQAVRITYEASQDTPQVANISGNGTMIQFSTLEQLSGGEDIDLSYVDFINSSNNKTYPSLYKYSSVSTIKEPSDTNISFKKTKNKYLIFGINSNTQNPDGSVSILLPKIQKSKSTNYKDVYFFCRVDTGIKEKNELCGITIEITGPTGKAIKLVNLNTDESTSASSPRLSLKANTTLNFKFSFPASSIADKYYLKITKSALPEGSGTDDRKVQLSFPRLSEKENPLLGVKFSDNKTMLDYLNFNYKKELKYFYFISYGNPDKRIDISKYYPLNSDKAFYDYDNIANKWVLPKIDFENSTIKIAQTSLIK